MAFITRMQALHSRTIDSFLGLPPASRARAVAQATAIDALERRRQVDFKDQTWISETNVGKQADSL